MPRRIYEYDASAGLDDLQPDLDDRLVRPRARRAARRSSTSSARSRAAPIAGPDPWKANTLEWFTPSPPPENNFDVDPARALGRADEGHPAPGRAGVRRRRSASRPAGRWWRDEHRAAHHRPRRCRPRGVRQVLGRLRRADQAARPVAAAADDDDDDVRGRRPVGRARAADLPGRLAVGRRRGRGQPLVRPRHRRADGAHGRRGRCRRGGSRRGAALALRARCWARCRSPGCSLDREPAARRARAVPASSATCSSTRCG